MTEPTLSLRGLTKSFGALQVLNGIDLDLMPGEVLGLIGPSGSGKSTLIRCMNMMELPSSGTLLFKAQAISPRFRGSAGQTVWQRHRQIVGAGCGAGRPRAQGRGSRKAGGGSAGIGRAHGTDRC